MPAQARTPVAISQMSTPKAYTSAAAEAAFRYVSMMTKQGQQQLSRMERC
jgi:hypothetical protein